MLIEGVHPLEGGLLRLKFRSDRRNGLPLESPLLFYPKYYAEMTWKQIRWVSLYARFWLLFRKVRKDPKRLEYTDLALEPVTDHEEERELFQTDAAKSYLAKIERLKNAMVSTSRL